MIKLGKVQELVIIGIEEFGVYLAEKEGDEAAVPLPKKQVPEGAGIGDKVEVFIYKDSSDRLIATMGKLKLQMGETAKLEAKDMVKIGAFPGMGLEKDLLPPFKEQTHPVRKGEQCLVTPHMDKNRRLAATMRICSHVSNQSSYKAEDWVTGTIHEINETIGAFVAMDHKYYGLIPKKELYGRFRKGDTVQARVTRVCEDGKLDLCVREKSYVQMGTGAEKVLKVMNKFDGVLPFNDKIKSEVIVREFSMSKDAFKRAVGGPLKEGRIRITDKTIERAQAYGMGREGTYSLVQCRMCRRNGLSVSADGVDRLRHMGYGLRKERGDMKKRNPATNYAMIVAGTFLTGFAIKNIYDPVSMVTGGVSGTAIIAEGLRSVPLQLANTVLNVPLFVAGFFFYGWRFTKRTLFATVMLSVPLYVLPEASYLGNDLPLSALLGGITSGVGTGLVFLTSCTIGGTDSLAALIQKRLKHYILAQIIQILDGLIVVAGVFVFDIRSAFYAPIAIFCVAKVTDGLIEGPKLSKQAYTISEHYREIAEAIMEQMGGGVTSPEARGTYSDQEKEMLFCVVSKKEVVRLKEIVAEFDSSVLVIVSDAREIFDEGFIEYQVLNFVAFASISGKNAVD